MAASFQVRRILAHSILAGFIAGGILAALYISVLQPFQNLLAEGIIDELIAQGVFDEDGFDTMLKTVYLGQTLGSAAVGLAAGALVGAVCIIGKKEPSFTNAILVAGISWFVLYAVPAAKYPSSPMALFSDAVGVYYPLYFAYLAVSGLTALGIVAGFRKVQGKNKIFGMAAVYLVVMAVAYFAFPPYELDSTFDQSLLRQWQALVSAATTAFWFSTGMIAGLLWKYGSDKQAEKKKGK
jgi:hypothetical protein